MASSIFYLISVTILVTEFLVSVCSVVILVSNCRIFVFKMGNYVLLRKCRMGRIERYNLFSHSIFVSDSIINSIESSSVNVSRKSDATGLQRAVVTSPVTLASIQVIRRHLVSVTPRRRT